MMPLHAQLDGERAVDIKEIALAKTSVSYGDCIRWVKHTQLVPEPCGICKGTGNIVQRLVTIKCRLCEGRGFDPEETLVKHLVGIADDAFDKGRDEQVRRQNIIDVPYESPPPKAIEEKPESYLLCAECLCAECECEK